MIAAKKIFILVLFLISSSVHAQPSCNLKMPTINQIKKILKSNLSESDRYAAILCLTSAINDRDNLTDSDINKIADLLEDRNPAITVIAADALAKLGKKAKVALPALKKALQANERLSLETIGPSLGPEHSIRAAISSIDSDN
jgi:hypothetical protein